MSKYGLGRGLSSLFATYSPAEQSIKKTTPEPLTDRKGEDALSKANNIIQKDNQNSKTEIKLNETNEIVERSSFLQEKEALNQKLSKIEKTLPSAEQKEQAGNVLEISLSKIDVNINQPRKSFDKESLQELSESIKQHGVIQPIIVVPNGERWTIVAGERRYRSAKMAGLKTIPSIVKNYTTKQIKEIALIENLQREDLNAVETAYALKQLIEDYNFTQDEVAEKIGKTRTVVTNFLRILKLEPEVLSMVEKGKLSLAHAKAIVSITDRETQIKLAKKACDDKISSKELEIMVQNLLNPEKTKKNTQIVGLEMKKLTNDMQYIFGTKVSVIGSDKRGRIYIDYYNKDDLDRISTLMDKLR